MRIRFFLNTKFYNNLRKPMLCSQRWDNIWAGGDKGFNAYLRWFRFNTGFYVITVERAKKVDTDNDAMDNQE